MTPKQSNGRNYLSKSNIVSNCVGHNQDICKQFLSFVTALALREFLRKGWGVIAHFTAEAAQYYWPLGVRWAHLEHPGWH